MTKKTIAVKTNGTVEIEIESKKIEHKLPEIKIEATENQMKLIDDKYLRDAPTVAHWLWNVAYNIALADLLYDPLVPQQNILEGIKHSVEKKAISSTLATELLLIHCDARNYNEQEANHKKFIQNLYTVAETNEYAAELVYATAEKFFKMLGNWEFLPNSPTLMNAGRELQQLSACYVLPVLDSIEGWGDLVKATMLIHKCLVPDTLVMTDKGLVQLGSVDAEQKIATDEGEYHVSERHENGEQAVFTVKNEHGYELTGTAEHRIRVINGNGKPVWKKIGELKKGDWTIMNTGEWYGKSRKLPTFEFKAKKGRNHTSFRPRDIKIPTEITEEFAELIGSYIGDGSNHRDGIRFTVGKADSDIVERIKYISEKIFEIKPVVSETHNNAYEVALLSVQLKAFFEFLDITKQSAKEAKVPNCILSSDAKIACAFLRGLFTSDGCIREKGHITLCTTSSKLAKQVQVMMLYLGMPTKKYVQNDANYLSIANKKGFEGYRASVGFACTRKALRLANIEKEQIFTRAEYIPHQVQKLRNWYNNLDPTTKQKLENIHALEFQYQGRELTTQKLQTIELLCQEKTPQWMTDLLNTQCFYSRVESVTFAGIQTVMDLTIPNKHAYLANGFVSHNSGGGTGFSGCRVRPRGDRVKSTKGIASGALSPFQIINYATQEVKQGGTRRGANMGILPYWHPDIFDFIASKSKEGVLENFNISVAIDKKFVDAVKNGQAIDIVNPRSREVVKTIPATELFNLITDYAWRTGDPGVVFIDVINNSLSNPTPELGEVEATNPCGEQPLLPFEPCNLGSINLSKFVKEGAVDFEKLGEVAKLAVKFLDNVIDVNNYPLPEIEQIAKGNRRIGLGVMGWAEMLVLLGIPYDSEEAIAKAEEVMKFINEKSLEASEELAIQRGLFPNFKNSIYDKEGPYCRPYASGKPRNCARTTIAPTGTIAVAAGLQGSGIEPFFAIAYERYNGKALDALKKGEKPNESDVFHEVNPLFAKTAVEYEFFGMDKNELWKKIEANHKSIRGIIEIPEHIQKIFASAHDVKVEWHVRHQASFQKHVDNGVSKTINLPNSATVEDVEKTYIMAFETGCKGITVYRDGCKTQQVLNLTSAEKKKESKDIEIKKLDYSEGISSKYYKFETGYGPVHIHVDHADGDALRIFANTTPVGTEIAGLTTALGIMISKYLERGGDLIEIRKQLNSIKSDKSYGFGPNRIESIPHAMSVAITKFLREHGKIQDMNQTDLTHHLKAKQNSNSEQNNLQNNTAAPHSIVIKHTEPPQVHCPKCYSPNIAFVSGCSGPTCFDCGHSQCS